MLCDAMRMTHAYAGQCYVIFYNHTLSSRRFYIKYAAVHAGFYKLGWGGECLSGYIHMYNHYYTVLIILCL